MNKKTKTAVKKSIKHHKTLKAWAKKQNPLKRIFGYLDMKRDLNGECLNSSSCSLCMVFCCDECPLTKIDDCCFSDGSTYQNLVNSKTWGTYVKNEDKMIAVLKSLLK